MSTDTPVLRGSTYPDLLAIPSVLLGFHPEESCVVMGMCGSRVAFGARVDLDWPRHRLDSVVDPILRALENVGECDVVILGYGADPGRVADSADQLGAVLGGVQLVVISDGSTYWTVRDGQPEPPEGTPHAFTDCGIAAQAVYNGISVEKSRNDAIAAVRPPSAARLEDVERACARALEALGAWEEDAKLSALGRLVESTEPLRGDEAALLGQLLAQEELMAEILVRLNTRTAGAIRAHLVTVRQWCCGAAEGTVVALLGLSCWLDSRGAQTNDCMDQLALVAPGHPLLELLRRVHNYGLPPGLWDLD